MLSTLNIDMQHRISRFVHLTHVCCRLFTHRRYSGFLVVFEKPNRSSFTFTFCIYPRPTCRYREHMFRFHDKVPPPIRRQASEHPHTPDAEDVRVWAADFTSLQVGIGDWACPSSKAHPPCSVLCGATGVCERRRIRRCIATLHPAPISTKRCFTWLVRPREYRTPASRTRLVCRRCPAPCGGCRAAISHTQSQPIYPTLLVAPPGVGWVVPDRSTAPWCPCCPSTCVS
jgi:hypothetical protein